MFLGIEIGGTKLQLAVGARGGEPLVELERFEVNRAQGARGIREAIGRCAERLRARHTLKAVGIGFGGPIDVIRGRTLKSHQIDGWDDFPLAQWCRETFGLPVGIGNDADTAGLAEAVYGAGRGHRVVFYITVGSGIGGALVIDGAVYTGGSGIAAEIGHLRPGPQAERADQTVESIASGWGIAAGARARLGERVTHPLKPLIAGGRPRTVESLRRRLIEAEEAEEEYAADLLSRCDGRLEQLTTKLLGQAAAEGNRLAEEELLHATQTLGWAVAQVITLVAPEVVVIGGGVPLVGDTLFFAPLREEVARYVFPPLKDRYHIVPAALGEEVVLHGALRLAESFAR